MKQVILILVVVILTPFFLASSCQKQTGCKDVACTMMFAMVTVEVKSQDGTPIQLDDVYSIRKSKNETIRSEQQMPQSGTYVVLDDGYVQKLRQATDSFLFVGVKNGEKIIEEPYVISADCCHIDKKSGKAVITWN